MIHRAELLVKYGIFIILTSLEESTKYVNFSTEEAGTSVPVTHRYEVHTVAESSEVYNYLPIMGSGVGGLVLLALITAALYKLGFFKRKYKQMMKGAVKDEGPGPTQSAATGHLPTSDDPKQ